MELMDKVGRYGFLVEPFHCDFSQRVFIGHLGNNLLNAADFHSAERGYGMDHLNSMHRTWVLSRLVMEMDDLPEAYDRIEVETWVEASDEVFHQSRLCRDRAARACLRIRTEHLGHDRHGHTPAGGHNGGAGRAYIAICGDGEGMPDSPTVARQDGRRARLARTVDTRYSDVDVNGHVNSVKYIEHILDLWDMEWHAAHAVQRFDIAYVAESHCGDKLGFRVEPVGDAEFCVRVTKCSGESGDGVEVCRCKIKFAKK